MPSAFDSHFADTGRSVLMDVHGETVSYTPQGGQAAEITAIWSDTEADTEHEPDGRVRKREAVCWISADDVAAPAERDLIERDEVTWTVVRIGRRQGGLIELYVQATEAQDTSRPHVWMRR